MFLLDTNVVYELRTGKKQPSAHGMTLVTRNVRDFAATGVRLDDPFHEAF